MAREERSKLDRLICPEQFSVCALQMGGLTNAFSFSGAWLKTVIALAAVASYCVDTTPVLTDAGLGAALVQVY